MNRSIRWCATVLSASQLTGRGGGDRGGKPTANGAPPAHFPATHLVTGLRFSHKDAFAGLGIKSRKVLSADSLFKPNSLLKNAFPGVFQLARPGPCPGLAPKIKYLRV